MKRWLWILVSLLLFALASAVTWAALPATDAFTAANGTALTTYSTNWALNSGNFAINTNAVHPNQTTAECGARWTADVFGNDQYSQGRLANLTTTGQTVGVAVRMATSGAASYYGYYADGSGSGKTFLFKMVSGTWTQLGSLGAALSANDVLRLEVSGTTLTPKVNGATQSPPGAQSDSALSSGAGGLSGYSVSTSMRLDDWEGGNLAAPAITRPRRIMVSGLGGSISGTRGRLAVVRWFDPPAVGAQTTFSRFYILPVIGSGSDHTDGRRPKYVDALGTVPWSAMDYGAEPVMLLRAEVTAAEDALLTSNPDVFAIPLNLDATLTPAQAASARAALEAVHIPAANWVTTSVTGRQMVRTIAQVMQFSQRLAALRSNRRTFGGSVTLATPWSQLSAEHRSAIVQAASSLRFSLQPPRAVDHLRDVLKAMADQWGSAPIFLGGSPL